MKPGVRHHAATMQFDHSVGGSRHTAMADGGAHPPRQGRAVSEAIVSRFVAGFDTVAIFVTGIAAMHWDSSPVDWRLEGLVVLLGTLLGMNFLHLAGAHRFAQFGDLGAAIGRALLGWLLTLGALFLATLLFEPITATDGPWIALWFSGGVVLLVASRVVLHHQMVSWSRAGRLGEVVAIVGAGPIAQRLLRSLNAAHGRPRASSASTTTMRRPCRDGAWDTPSSARSTSWFATCGFTASTLSSWRCPRRPTIPWSRR